MSKGKKFYFLVLILITILVTTFYFSYAIFSNTQEEHGKLNIVAGTLNYKMESSELDSDSITLPANTSKEIKIKLTSLNEVSSKYELYYILDKMNDKVSVGYSKDTKDSVLGTVEANKNKIITIVIRNDSDTSSKVTFKVLGGLLNNNLALKDGNSLNQEVSIYRVLSKAILEDNKLITATPTLTTSSNNTSDESGLYSSTATNTGEPTYYFRGNVENNYLSFAGFTWRIVRINEDGTVRLIMQDGINDNTNYQFNSNYNNYTYMYYTNSEVKPILENWYQENIEIKSNLTDKTVSGNYYCEQAKVKDYSDFTDGNANMAISSNYIPSFKCSTDGNNKGIVNGNIGLINYDELIYAGVKSGVSYLYNLSIPWWTMSPAGVSTSNCAVAWDAQTGLGSSGVYNKFTLRPVINLKTDVVVSGNGKSSNPYQL